MLHDCASDEFWNSRDDSVAASVQSVHPIGRPVIHSAKQGLRKTIVSAERRPGDVEQMRRATRPPLSSRASTDALEQSFHSLAGRVGNNPSSFAGLRGTNKPARQSIPLRIVPESGKGPEYDVKSVPGEAIDVFDDGRFRLEFVDEPRVFEPEPALLSVERCVPSVHGSGDADILAWESAAENMNGMAACIDVSGEGSDIVMTGDSRPPPGEYSPAECGDLAECDGSHSGPFEPEAESSDSAEEIEDIHRHPVNAKLSAERLHEGEKIGACPLCVGLAVPVGERIEMHQCQAGAGRDRELIGGHAGTMFRKP
jgi:hypothetical protein